MTVFDHDFKEVYYDQYCKTCKYEKLAEEDETCDYCLDHPINLYSHKPVNWEGKEGYEDYIAPEPTEPVAPEKPEVVVNLFNEDGD